jgi:hypothetical protein
MKDVAAKKAAPVAERVEKRLVDLSRRVDRASDVASDFVRQTTRGLKRERRYGWDRVEAAQVDVEQSIRRRPIKTALMALGA